jgi:hypothetical protein
VGRIVDFSGVIKFLNLKNKTMTNFKLLMPDSYANIKIYAARYIDRLKTDLRTGIIKQDPNEEALVIYFDVASVMELIRQGGAACTYLSGVLGIHTTDAGEDQFTISLLCADKFGEVLQEHKNGTLDGQEVWPYRASIADFNSVLP